MQAISQHYPRQRVVGQTITVTGNYGTATHDPTIAQNKGWTVVTV
jgi:hypothetical protein